MFITQFMLINNEYESCTHVLRKTLKCSVMTNERTEMQNIYFTIISIHLLNNQKKKCNKNKNKKNECTHVLSGSYKLDQ